jgi:N-acetylglucosamine kinase-like BadF-type ATPase
MHWKIIADGGSTKTDWRLISESGDIRIAQSGGINPLHISKKDAQHNLSVLDKILDDASSVELWFYGAGITGDIALQQMEELFRSKFGAEVSINIGDDLLAAARAIFHNDDGIVCILGTGSNSGLSINNSIVKKIPALGYILGDEGSGADIGKRWINAIFKQELPREIIQEVLTDHEIDMHEVIHEVYRGKLPARYLASFSKMVSKYIAYPEVESIVEMAFKDFIQRNLLKYENCKAYKIGFVGSVAFHFQNILVKVCEKHGFHSMEFVQSPIDQLVEYHK